MSNTEPETYLIWSEEHGGWWRPASHGYTRELAQAGRYTLLAAAAIVQDANKHLPSGFNEVIVPDPMRFNAAILKDKRYEQ